MHSPTPSVRAQKFTLLFSGGMEVGVKSAKGWEGKILNE